jgi:hypothetical protein
MEEVEQFAKATKSNLLGDKVYGDIFYTTE